MAYVILAVAVALAVGLVVGAAIGAGLGGALVALAFLAMVFMAIMSPPGRPWRRTGREAPSTWSAFGLPSRQDDDPIE